MAIDPRELRSCLGQFATGVTVVACQVGDTVHGATVNAFTAVSLDPPLVLVSLDRRSKACEYLADRPFSVTVLAAESHELALHFAGRHQEHLDLEWAVNAVAPRVAGGAASFSCTPWASYDGGDHVLYVGQVQEFTHRPNIDPLLFHSGRFRVIGGSVSATPWFDTLDSPECTVGWWMGPLSAGRI